MRYPNAEELRDMLTHALAYGEVDPAIRNLSLYEEPGRGYASRDETTTSSTGMGNRDITYVITVEVKKENDSRECPECSCLFADDDEVLDEIFEHVRDQHGWNAADCAQLLNDMADDDTLDPDQYLQ